MLRLGSKTYCWYDVTSNKFIFSSRGLNKRQLEQNSDGPLQKYRRVSSETVNVTSNKRGFRANKHSVFNYEQVTEGPFYFYPKQIVESDGMYTKVPDL